MRSTRYFSDRDATDDPLVFLYDQRPKRWYFRFVTQVYTLLITLIGALIVILTVFPINPSYFYLWVLFYGIYHFGKQVIKRLFPKIYTEYYRSEIGGILRSLIISFGITLFLWFLYDSADYATTEYSSDSLWLLYFLATLVVNRSGARTWWLAICSIVAATCLAYTTWLSINSTASPLYTVTTIGIRLLWLTLLTFVTHALIRFLSDLYMDFRLMERVENVIVQMRLALDEKPLVRNLVNEIASNFHYRNVAVYYLMNFKVDTNYKIRVKRIASSTGEEEAIELRSNSLISSLHRDPHSYVIEMLSEPRRRSPFHFSDISNARLTLPIYHRDAVIGIMEIDAPNSNVFGARDIEVMRTLLHRFSVAVDNVRILERFRTIVERLCERILSQEEPNTILREVADAVVEQLDADIVLCYLHDPNSDKISGPFRSGSLFGEMPKVVNFYPDSTVYKVIHDKSDRDFYFHSDLSDIPSTDEELFRVPTNTKTPSSTLFIHRENIQSRAVLRLRTSKGSVGVMFVNFRYRRHLEEDERQWLTAFARLATLAIQNIQLQEVRLTQQLQLQREDLALHLHENFISKVTGILSLLQRQLETENLSYENRVMAGTAWETTDDVRRSLRYLFDTFADLTVGDLDEEIEKISRRAIAAYLVKFQVELEGICDESVPPWIVGHAVSILNELVTNSGIHGKPREMNLKVTVTTNTISIAFQDDGRGFDVKWTEPRGLRNIQNRVDKLGGHFGVVSDIGKGTSCTVILPFLKEER